MNYLKKIPFLLHGLFLFSCLSQPVENVADQNKIDPPVEVMKTEVVNEFLVTSEVVTFPDGKSDSQKEYQYNDQGLLLEKRILSGQGDMIMRTEKRYEGRMVVRENLFDNNGLISYTLFGYLEDQLIEESYFDAQDNYLSGSRFSYNQNGKRELWVSLDKNGSPIMKTRYTYEGDLLKKLDYLTPYDESEGYTEFKYSQGLILEEASYNRSGDLEKKMVWKYEGENPVEVTSYFGNRVNRINHQSFDERGLLVSREVVNRAGRSIQSETFQYEEFSHEIQILVKE